MERARAGGAVGGSSTKRLTMKSISQSSGRLRYLCGFELATIPVAQAGVESLGRNLDTGQLSNQRKNLGEIPRQIVHDQPIPRAQEHRTAKKGGGPGWNICQSGWQGDEPTRRHEQHRQRRQQEAQTF